MTYTKEQVDARLALRSLKKPRSKRAVLAPKEALRYRYEGKQFFHLDFATFIDLFAALPSQQLSKVARAPEVLEEHGGRCSTFEDFWPRLYQGGREDEPVLATLSLVGMPRSI